MLPQLDNINIIVPREHLSFNARRTNLTVQVNVSFRYTHPDNTEVFWITATRAMHPNILWTKAVYDFIDSYVHEYVLNTYAVEAYETCMQ